MDKNIDTKTTTNEPTPLIELPVLPLRDVVVYPYMVIPLFVGRERSIKSLEAATDESKQILLIAQKDSTDENPNASNLSQYFTITQVAGWHG